MKPIETEKILVKKLVESSIQNKKIGASGGLQIKKLTGDASTRRYYRVGVGNESYVVCLDEPFENKESYPFWETWSFLKEQNIPVPEILDIDCENGYLLEEDLGDLTLLKHLSQCDFSEQKALYKSCLDLVFNYIKSTELIRPRQSFAKKSFDVDKLMYEVGFCNKYFLSNFLGIEDEENIFYVIQEFKEISKSLAEIDKVFVHRDFHSRNLMIKDDRVRVIDFQDSMMGPPQYDLVSLIEDCYFQLPVSMKGELKNDFYQKLKSEGLTKQTEQEFMYIYDLMAIQRAYKAIGSFSYIYHERGDIRYVKYIGYCFEKLRIILSQYSEFGNLKNLLGKMYYES